MNHHNKLWEGLRLALLAALILTAVAVLFAGFVNLVSEVRGEKRLENLRRDDEAFSVIEDVRIYRVDDTERGVTCYVPIRHRADTAPSIDCVPQASLTSP